MTAESVLGAICGALVAGLVILIVTFAALVIRLRKRHEKLWRSLGSPWFSYMQSFTNPDSAKFVRYVRARQFGQLATDKGTLKVANLGHLLLRFGGWYVLVLARGGRIYLLAVAAVVRNQLGPSADLKPTLMTDSRGWRSVSGMLMTRHRNEQTQTQGTMTQ